MIHDDLERHFGRRPPPSLSADFDAKLGRRLRAVAARRRALPDTLARYAPRLYWVAAAVALACFWRPAVLPPAQVAVLASWAAIAVFTLKRALRTGPLPRVLRQAFWGR